MGVGARVGLRVGDFVGARVGDFVGARVGDFVGARVGDCVGARVGDFVGARVGDFVGLGDVSVLATTIPWPHFPHVLGHAASALVRIPTFPRLQYLARRRSLFAIQPHFFRFLRATRPTIAAVSRHFSSSEGHGTPQVTGQMTADNGVRYPGGGVQKVVLADSALICI